jgi:sugar O-acyltransferase (sialic acid O-acetyltransferase NeuD family)
LVTSVKTLIFGASRQGRVVLEVLRTQGRHPILGFLDDDSVKHGALLDGELVLGGREWAVTNLRGGMPAASSAHGAITGRRLAAIVAIGANDTRVDVARWLRSLGLELINAIHPSAVVQGNVSLGTGNLVCAGAILVTGTRVEDDVIINTGAIIDHDCLLESGAQVAPGVATSGCVTIRRGAFVGVGSILGPGVTIGERAIIGAGSLVLKDIPPGVLAYGTPCRTIRELPDPPEWASILAGQDSVLRNQ